MDHALTLPVPATVGSIEGYIQAINRFPILSQEEEYDLASRFRRENDLEAARQLIVSHLRLVVSVARGYIGYGLPQADLIQEGNIGLMKAVKRYDPDRGVRLVSFALHWIRAEIHEYILRNWRLVKIATTKAQRKLFFNLRSLKQNLGALKPQEANAIAQQLNVSPDDVLEMEARFNGHELALDAEMNDEEGGSFAPAAYLASSPDDEPSSALEHKQMDALKTEGLARALENLDERSRRIIEARWLRNESATLHELASEFNVSAERIRQIEQKALTKMQTELLSATT